MVKPQTHKGTNATPLLVPPVQQGRSEAFLCLKSFCFMLDNIYYIWHCSCVKYIESQRASGKTAQNRIGIHDNRHESDWVRYSVKGGDCGNAGCKVACGCTATIVRLKQCKRVALYELHNWLCRRKSTELMWAGTEVTLWPLWQTLS